MANTDQDIRDLAAKYEGFGVLESLNASFDFEHTVTRSFTATIVYPDLEERLVLQGTLVNFEEEQLTEPFHEHSWEIIIGGDGVPHSILCAECGDGYPIQSEEKPKPQEAGWTKPVSPPDPADRPPGMPRKP